MIRIPMESPIFAYKYLALSMAYCVRKWGGASKCPVGQRSTSGVVPHKPSSLFLETGCLPGLELTKWARLVDQ